jgi:uncharacterized protein (TIGR02996 family)
MNDEDAFLRQILQAPADDTPRLVYADWLDERGDPVSVAKAEFLRTQHQLRGEVETKKLRRTLEFKLRELALVLRTEWLASVSHLLIENCPPRENTTYSPIQPLPIGFEFRCPKQWSELEITDDLKVRFCQSCRQSVYFCVSVLEAWSHARRGHCVAVSCSADRWPGDLETRVERGMIEMGLVRPPS